MQKKLPNPPAEVLELFDRLSPELVEKIQIQMLEHQMKMFAKVGDNLSEKKFREVMFCSQMQFDRLIREAAKEREDTDDE